MAAQQAAMQSSPETPRLGLPLVMGQGFMGMVGNLGRDLQTGKAPPGLVYDAAQADFSRIRCDVAYLPDGVSWRKVFEEREEPKR